LQKHPSTISFHIKKLIEHNIIEPAGIGDGYVYRKKSGLIIQRPPMYNETVYCLVDYYSVYDAFLTYENSLPDLPHIKMFIHFLKKNSRDKNWYPRKITNLNDLNWRVDKIKDVLLEIFPLPYYL
jgi:hypothetical protein